MISKNITAVRAQITALPNPLNPNVLPRVRLFGIIGTWMEEDVIAATIKNAMTQGCERVYIVDNGSTDETVSLALAQGAILARSFVTQQYDETLRLHHMNAVVHEVSQAEVDQELWWLFLDGDEFPHGPWGMRLVDYLRTLDSQFRVVGSRFFNHYPGAAPHYFPNRHPLDFQPLCEEISLPMCASGHRKHSLLRYDKHAALIEAGIGFHLVYCADTVYEPTQPVFLHHFPFREETVTRNRLAALWAKNQNGNSRASPSTDTHMLARAQSLDAVYGQNWSEVVNFVPLDPIRTSLESLPPPLGVVLKPWLEMVEKVHLPVLRWYSISPIYEFLNHLIQRAAVKRIICIGRYDAENITWPEGKLEIVEFGPDSISTKEKRPVAVRHAVAQARFIKTDLERPFLIDQTLLEDAIVVCLDVLDQLLDPNPLINTLASARQYCKFMLLIASDRIRKLGYMAGATPADQMVSHWSAEEFIKRLVHAGFPPSMLFGFTSGSAVSAAKDTMLALAGAEAEPVIAASDFRVAAVINVFNEIDVIDTTIRYLADQGIEVHVVDNWSDDGTFELCQSLLQQNLVRNLLRFPDQKTNDYEWAKQLEHSAKYAARLDADWVIHYDADEIRCSPWQNVTLLEAVKFVDSLSYTAIDFTVLEFRFIDDIDKVFSIEEFNFFEFGRHSANFRQVKAWKNWGQTVDLTTYGGHEAIFEGQKVYPLKFLTKHFSLRSKKQAAKKIFGERIPRIAKEKAERGWHVHFDPYKHLSTIEPWTKQELIYFDVITFQHEFILERLSGVGIPQESHITLNKNSSAHLGVVMEEMASQLGAKSQAVAECDRQIASLNQAIAERDEQIAIMAASRSWQLTKPLRFVWQLIHSEFRMALMALQHARRLLATARALCHAVPRVVAFYGSLPLAIRSVLGMLKHEGFRGVMCRANIFMHGAGSSHHQQPTPSADLYGEVPPSSPGFMPKVSIIVPNFNHAKYLPERLESIYGQTYSNVEVILLDDCSGDESVAILRDYAGRHPGKTICRFNEVNSGGVFNQWKKGLELATGDLIWIAESDDWCSANLLEELVRCFRNPAVMLAFARSDFVRGTPPMKVWTTEEYLSDLDLGIWDRPFIQSAHALVKNGWAIKNLVPNVSSAVFRNPGKMTLFDDLDWARMRLCGDWIFYLSLIRGGLVAYSPSATNYYRQHPLNTSVNAQNENIYYQEFEVVARHLMQNYALERSDLEKQERQLYQHWCSRRGYSREDEFSTLYDLDRIWQAAASRKPSLVMAVYALTAGGGETFPIMLANLLHDRGYAVTLLNCRQQPTEPGVRNMLSRSIPLLELKNLGLLDAAFADMGVELVHSHHASVDMMLATCLLNHHRVRQVVTLHGMYEMMTRAQMNTLMPLLGRIDSFVYVAEKNLLPFSQAFRDEKRFSRIDNALPSTVITPVPRAELGLGDEDFVLCLVSRAMPDKGWEEAIGAVTWAHARSSRKIHLMLIGDGVEFERLRSGDTCDFVHFLGFRSNTRDYFATADIGFLPSRFKGESFPLVLIDCLLAGKPVLASDVGEIRYMLDSSEGLAGELFGLEAWEIRVEALGQIILTLASDPLAYQRLLRCVPLAAAKFDADTMVDKYEGVYKRGLASLLKSADISAHHQAHP